MVRIELLIGGNYRFQNFKLGPGPPEVARVARGGPRAITRCFPGQSSEAVFFENVCTQRIGTSYFLTLFDLKGASPQWHGARAALRLFHELEVEDSGSGTVPILFRSVCGQQSRVL